ncbi:MAG: ester cyclase [Woeseiaceae bacterium]|nr:ester cyclase [Woeseiaceae bacterium]
MTQTANEANKQHVWNYWKALQSAGLNQALAVASEYLDDGHRWQGFDPVHDLDGPAGFVEGFWEPLLTSFPDVERHTWIFFGGKSSGRIDGTGDGRMWVTGTGVLRGRFAEDYLGIPANGDTVDIRWGEFCRLDDGRIVETFFLVDMIDLMQQAGFNVLPPSRGKDGIYPPPAAGDGVQKTPSDTARSDYSLDHIRRFIFDGLNSYDENNLESMGMAAYFHPDLRWYGPGGIGACLSFQEFETNHQAHWLHAFPDRSVQDLDALIAEGAYSGGPGWDGVIATQKGEYLQHPASGNRLGVNGLDWWKREGEQYVENWVFVDMIHLFRQLGVDLMARLDQQKDRTSPGLER